MTFGQKCGIIIAMDLKNIYLFVRNFLKKIANFIPSKLPVGSTEFDIWSQDIIDTYSPAGDAKSVKFVLSGLVMRLEQTQARKAKRFFALCLHRAAAGQVAAYKMDEIKQEQKAAYDAAAAAQASAQASATTNVATTPSPEAVAPNVQATPVPDSQVQATPSTVVQQA